MLLLFDVDSLCAGRALFSSFDADTFDDEQQQHLLPQQQTQIKTIITIKAIITKITIKAIAHGLRPPILAFPTASPVFICEDDVEEIV